LSHQLNGITNPELMNRALGSFLGLAVGDALGATVEFMTAREIAAQYQVHKEISGGGWLQLKAGRVTDDTEMALALWQRRHRQRWLELARHRRCVRVWMRKPPMDIGNTCRRGITKLYLHWKFMRAVRRKQCGNGAAMRHLPTVFVSLSSEELVVKRSIKQARITHQSSGFRTPPPATPGAHGRGGCCSKAGSAVRPNCRRTLVTQHPRFHFNRGRANQRLCRGHGADGVRRRLILHQPCRFGRLPRARRQSARPTSATPTERAGRAIGGCAYGIPENIAARWLNKLDPTRQRRHPDQVAEASFETFLAR